MAPVARLPSGSTVPQCAPFCPVLTGRIVGVDPGDWVKTIQFNSIQSIGGVARGAAAVVAAQHDHFDQVQTACIAGHIRG